MRCFWPCHLECWVPTPVGKGHRRKHSDFNSLHSEVTPYIFYKWLWVAPGISAELLTAFAAANKGNQSIKHINPCWDNCWMITPSGDTIFTWGVSALLLSHPQAGWCSVPLIAYIKCLSRSFSCLPWAFPKECLPLLSFKTEWKTWRFF